MIDPIGMVRTAVSATAFLVVAAAGHAAAAQDGAACPASLQDQPIGFNLSSLEAIRGNADDLGDARRPALVALKSRAERALSDPIVAVTDKPQAGPSGDKRDYLSLAPYWWPNPQSKDGLPYIRRDGETNPDRSSERFDRVRLQTMVNNVVDLSIAAYVTGDDRFADKAAEQVRVWFVDAATRMNPNLNYAQAIPGRNDGRAIGIIDSRLFMDVADAVVLLGEIGAVDQSTEVGFRQWIGAFSAWLIQSPFGLEERRAENNHGTFYDAQLAHFLVTAGRCDLVVRVLEDTKARVVGQIKPNGFQPLEAKRTRSLHYHAFNLDAFLRLALIAQRLGIDLYDYELPASGSIRDGIHRIARYADDADNWPHPRRDDMGQRTVWLSLMRARMIDPDDKRVNEALRTAQGASPDSLLHLLTYQPPSER